MSYSDTIADMLTRIRNATRNKADKVDCRHSKVCQGIAQVLQQEGYIEGFNVIETTNQGILRLDLKYGMSGEQLFHKIVRESKPGRRVYVKADDMPRPLAGLGIAIVSTPQGVLSDRQAREAHIGGELLATIE